MACLCPRSSESSGSKCHDLVYLFSLQLQEIAIVIGFEAENWVNDFEMAWFLVLRQQYFTFCVRHCFKIANIKCIYGHNLPVPKT